VESNRIRDRIKTIREDVASVAMKCNRDVSLIQIMAVTKRATVEQIVEAKICGLDLFGENYIKDASFKIPPLLQMGGFGIEQFHLIGHLQSNKVKKAVSLFSSIDSVDSIHLVRQIAHYVSNRVNPYPIFLEIKTAADEAKSGFSPASILDLYGEIIQFDTITVRGLLTIGKLEGTETETRTCFQTLVRTKEKIEKSYSKRIPVLSMGMSNDYKIAIEEGSDMIRIGSAIFGG